MIRSLIKLFVLAGMISNNLYAQQLAFPGAEGFGRFATGGRGGTVYHVTKLTDDGSVGTFRYGINLSGARTIVFDLSGTIALRSNLTLNNGNITIAGQTAPGDGICIKNYTFNNNADNVIIRYIRFRPGDEATAPGDEAREYDAATGRYRNNIIIDHCSFSWANDEVCSFYNNNNFTLQWCLISESFYLSTHPKGAHGYGGIWGGYKASFHHNLMAHHSSRNPRFSGKQTGTPAIGEVDFVNNVIYNWGGNSAYGGETSRHNIVNNYYKPGPATKTGVVSYRIVQPSDTFNMKPVYSKWYVSGNYTVGNAAVSADNWSGGVQPYRTSIPVDSFKVAERFNYAQVNTQTATEAFNLVLEKTGCNVPKRDTVDARIIDEAKRGIIHFGGTYGANKGIIDSQTTVGGFPVLNSKPASLDTDKDGMPDFWEKKQSLNINDASDRNGDLDIDGYTNLEEYMNALADGDTSAIDPATAIDNVKFNNFSAGIYPNPVAESSVIRFNNPRMQKINILLCDVHGKFVSVIANEIFPAGDASIPLSFSGETPGVYLIHFKMNDFLTSRKVLYCPDFR